MTLVNGGVIILLFPIRDNIILSTLKYRFILNNLFPNGNGAANGLYIKGEYYDKRRIKSDN